MLIAKKDLERLLLVSGGDVDIYGSVLNDTIVKCDSSLHVRGDLKGSLTVERGGKVVVEGLVDGKVVNRGGRLVINNRDIAEFVTVEGPPEAEAGGILKIDLANIALNWSALARQTLVECAAVVKADAYGCGIGPVSATLAKSGCRTFFVSNLAEARRVRAVAANATIYVLGGVFSGTGPVFAEINAQPVITNFIEMAEWDVFVASSGWTGSFALHVDIGASRHGISMQDAVAVAGRLTSSSGLSLLMSHLDNAGRPDHSSIDRQIKEFQDLRRLLGGVPASLANSAGIFLGPKAHCNLVRPGAALFGVNPTPAVANPMLPVIELTARVAQIRNVAAGETLACNAGWVAKRTTRLATISVGYVDGYPRSLSVPGHTLQAIVAGQPCPLAGAAGMDQLAIDLSGLRDPGAVRPGDLVTLIGKEICVDYLAAAAKSNGRELLCNLGRRFHRIYYAS
jgi:alanine racemase